MNYSLMTLTSQDVCGNPTTIMVTNYVNRVFVVVTQMRKLGTMVSLLALRLHRAMEYLLLVTFAFSLKS